MQNGKNSALIRLFNGFVFTALLFSLVQPAVAAEKETITFPSADSLLVTADEVNRFADVSESFR